MGRLSHATAVEPIVYICLLVLGGGDSDVEELQMAANEMEGSRVVVAAPAQYEVSLESQQYDDYSYDWDKLFGGFYKK